MIEIFALDRENSGEKHKYINFLCGLHFLKFAVRQVLAMCLLVGLPSTNQCCVVAYRLNTSGRGAAYENPDTKPIALTLNAFRP